jgi:hypothetical protein
VGYVESEHAKNKPDARSPSRSRETSTQQQGELTRSISGSPGVLAQRKQYQSLFGDLFEAQKSQVEVPQLCPAPSFSSSPPVCQMNGHDALRYAKKRGLRGKSDLLTLGGRPKKSLNKSEVMEILSDRSISVHCKETLRAYWNKRLYGTNRIELEDTPYRAELKALRKKQTEEYKSRKSLERINEYESETEDSFAGKEDLVRTMLGDPNAIVVTQGRTESPAHNLPLAKNVEVMRLIKRYRLFNRFSAIHLITKIGKFWHLYTAPRGNDFVYAPLMQTDKEDVFAREGGVDSWVNIADILTEELPAESGAFKNQVQRIISTFRGGAGPLTPGESHAVGAIMCDYAAGVRGAQYFLEILELNVNFGHVTTPKEAWAGTRPSYMPAAVNGRSLASNDSFHHRAKPTDHAEIAGRLYSVNVEGVRSTGECFWDTLLSYGIGEEHIVAAAADAHLVVNTHVMLDQMENYFNHLAHYTGVTYTVYVDGFDIFSLKSLGTKTIGEGVNEIYIGFFINPRDGQGHYVPRIK